MSFRYAFNGLKLLIREEHNARIHVFVATCVVIAGFAFGISANEWMAVTLCMGGVIALEMINSAIENIADFVSPGRHEHIQRIKDLAAGAVLVGVIASVAVGLMVFLPKVGRFF